MKEVEVNGNEFWIEIMRAIQTGVAETEKFITENTTQLDFRRVLLKTGTLYALNIKEAVNNVFKKYTEGESAQAVYKHCTSNGATYITTEPNSAERKEE